jgi:uncharacterized protein (TIGR03435 family)
MYKFCVLLLTGVAWGQTPAAGPVFEVATIKLAESPNIAKMSAGKLRIGLKIEAGRVDAGFMSLTDLIEAAYKVKSYQLSGPDWMNSQRFDVLAKMPDGSTKEQVPDMLKALLAERFKLVVHKESKEHSIYALVVGKGGSKLKESPPEPTVTGNVTGDTPPPAAGATSITTNTGTMSIKQNGDGRGATITTPGEGVVKAAMGADGNMHLEMSKMDMPKFAETVSRFVDRPVIDETGLKGNYQVVLDLSMADMMRVARMAGAAIPAGPVSAGGGAADAASDPGGGGSVFTAVQAMGLKLDPRKEAIDTFVVDHLEKLPTDN